MTLHQARTRLRFAQKVLAVIEAEHAEGAHVAPSWWKQADEAIRECRAVIAEAQARAAACDGKQKHPSAHAADVALSTQRRHRRTGQRLSALVTYKCRFCDSWHIGNLSTRTSRQAQKGTANAA